MSDRGNREDKVLDILAATKAELAKTKEDAAAAATTAQATIDQLTAQNGQLTTDLAAATARVPDAFDDAVDARASAVVGGKDDPGSPVTNATTDTTATASSTTATIIAP